MLATPAVDTEIGKRIRARRKALNMSQADLAALLRVSWQQIQKYEAGESAVRASALPMFARALHVPNEYFVSGLFDAEPTTRQIEAHRDVNNFLASDEGVLVMTAMLRMSPAVRASVTRIITVLQTQ
jgi:transcriptional regulator with XRE-family HTH domain